MRKSCWLKSIVLIFVFSLPLYAQTSADLRKKYQLSTFIEAFEVRPNIVATVSYGERGQAISILIRTRPTSDTNNQSKKEFPLKLAEELTEEFAPVSVRDKMYQKVDFESGRNTYRTVAYDNLIIETVIHDVGTGSVSVSQIYISWQKTLGR
jgi:hypothetical protein